MLTSAQNTDVNKYTKKFNFKSLTVFKKNANALEVQYLLKMFKLL